MKQSFVIFISMFFLCNSCGREEAIKDPSFCLNLVVTNPAKPQKLSIDIRPPHASYSNALIYIHRFDGRTTSLDYHEKGVVRRNMLDSMPLEFGVYEKFSKLVRESRVWEQKDIFGIRTDGKAYEINVSDSSRTHSFSLMGQVENRALLELIDFCTGQCDAQFPPVAVMDLNSEVVLKKFDRIGFNKDSVDIRFMKNGDAMIFHHGLMSYSLTEDEYVELWRVLENNRIWDLKSNDAYARKYPIEYRLEVRRGELSNEFTVYAPSKLSDKRYFNVINHMEALKPSK